MAQSRRRRHILLAGTLAVAVPVLAYQIYKYQQHLLFINRGTPIVRSVLLEAPGIVLMTDDLYNVALVIKTTDPTPGVSVDRDSISAEVSTASDFDGNIKWSNPIRVSVPADSNTFVVVDPHGAAKRHPLPKGASAAIRETYLANPDDFQRWLDSSPLATTP